MIAGPIGGKLSMRMYKMWTHSTNGKCDTMCFGCLPAAGVLTALTSLKSALPREKNHIPLTSTQTLSRGT